MDWLQFLQIVCVPAFVWLVHKHGEMRKELNDFKVQVAKEYATQVHINRLELKIDDLRQLIWEIVGLSIAGIEKNMRQMKEKGLTPRVGPDRGGYWKVLEI